MNQVMNKSQDQEVMYLLNDCASVDGGVWMGVGVVPCHPSWPHRHKHRLTYLCSLQAKTNAHPCDPIQPQQLHSQANALM